MTCLACFKNPGAPFCAQCREQMARIEAERGAAATEAGGPAATHGRAALDADACLIAKAVPFIRDREVVA